MRPVPIERRRPRAHKLKALFGGPDRVDALGMQEARLEKGSPEKLRIRARHLQGQAESLFNEAEQLLAMAREIEATQQKAGK